VPTHIVRPRNEGDKSSDAAPRRSPKEVAVMEKDRQQQKMSCLQELLAVTEDVSEIQLPLSQADVVSKLAILGTTKPLLACMDTRESPQARLQSAGMLSGHNSCTSDSLTFVGLGHVALSSITRLHTTSCGSLPSVKCA
jgi:hypothetical protein